MIENNHNGVESTDQQTGDFEQIGQRLKQAREARGLGQSEIASRLRLSLAHVQALEAGRGEPFGASIYVRGYVANYARQVGINPNKLLAGWQPSQPEPPLQAVAAPPPSHHLAEGIARWSTYLVGTAVAVLPILWWATEGSLDALLGARTAGPGEGAVPITGAAPDTATQPLRADGPGPGIEQPMLASMAPLRAPPQAAMGPPEPAGSTDTKTTPSASGEVSPPAPPLILELKADSWVEVRDADGRRLEYDLLRAGTTHRYRGEPPFQVLVGNAKGVTVRYNGSPFDFSSHVQGNLARFAVGALPEQG